MSASSTAEEEGRAALLGLCRGYDSYRHFTFLLISAVCYAFYSTQPKWMRLLPTPTPRVGRVGNEGEGIGKNSILGYREVGRSAKYIGRDSWDTHN